MGESLSWSHKEGNSLDQGVDEKNRNKEDDGLKVVEVEAQLMTSAKGTNQTRLSRRQSN